MFDIVLATLNARYWHASFGLRYLLANMGNLQSHTKMLEFGIKDNTIDLVAEILSHRPKIVGLGVYIWNVEPTQRLVAELKRVAPEVTVVVGGPEVSYDFDEQPIVSEADYLVSGEADLVFPKLCQQLLAGEAAEKIQHASPPALDQVALPYDFYTDEDVAHRVLYVEASRGCPFTCEFCLSALEIPVRNVDLDGFLRAMGRLLERGAKQFKFVDRTFNLNLRISQTILEFFLERYEPGLFLHFEMIPDRLPDALRELIARFPPGVLQFEIGVQTFNDQVGDLISRRQDNAKLEDNFHFLRQQTGVHLHADLIVGLPGEDVDSFGRGFDRLVALEPQEIQVGMLKRLRGTPITRHDVEWKMVYSPYPPYEILSTKNVDFMTMQRLRRFAKYWDLIGNSGNFGRSCKRLLADRPFDHFLRFSDWLYEQEGKTSGLSLIKLNERVFDYLCLQGHDEHEVSLCVWEDYVSGGRFDKPHFLRRFALPSPPRRRSTLGPPRQARHS